MERGSKAELRRVLNNSHAFGHEGRDSSFEGHKEQFWEVVGFLFFLFFFPAVCNCLSCVQPSHKTEHSHCLLKVRALCDEKKAFYLTFMH